ncbi:nucleolar complex protein 3 isoform X1 [Lycorma delicatula]|uniref:nucleolar complex protein 3 isoform X1 n=1 Tax=Lycorma delicatula TaxID=130591 RepID=UPI003F514F59
MKKPKTISLKKKKDLKRISDNKLFSSPIKNSSLDEEENVSESSESNNAEDNFINNRIPRKRKKEVTGNSNNNFNFEDQYERELDDNEHAGKKTRLLLPIKTGGKIIHRVGFVEEDLYDPKAPVINEKNDADEEKNDEDVEDEINENERERDLSEPVSTAELLAWREKALAKCRFKIGLLSSSILEDPEQNVSKLAQLNEMLKEYRPELAITVKKLVSVSLAEIFKDIIPSYQIKHQDDSDIKLKKETVRLQTFEKSLLKQYRLYLEKVEKMAAVFVKKKGDTRVHSEQVLGLGSVALNCLCELLITHPYFNYSTNIAQIIIPYMNNPRTHVRTRVASCISQVFKEDKRGELSLFIVRRINQLVKSKTNAVHSEVVSVFLSLRLKEINLDHEKEIELKEKQFKSKRQKLLTMSKKEKKAKKRLALLEQELMETKAEENKQEKQKILTEVTKVIFTVYFRILKRDPTSKLLCNTLEGIAKFAHLINLEFYQDLVNILSRLMENSGLDLHQQLLCIQTVLTILSGYGESLNIDPVRFYTHLYRNILSVHAGRTYCETELILKALDTVVIKRRKRITPQRLLAFTKRLATLSMYLLHNGSLGCLALIRNVLLLNKTADILLELDSSVGQGVYLPELQDPEHCNAASTALYELTALRRHYHPVVCKMAEHIIKNVPTTGEGSLPPYLSKTSSLELFKEFNPLEMVFKPTIPTPKNAKRKSKFMPHSWHYSDVEKLCNKVLSTDLHMESVNVYKEVSRNVNNVRSVA